MTTWKYKEYKHWLESGCPKDETVDVLYLYNNQLTSLPPEIGQLTNLTRLYLYNNQLTSLPPEIGQLTNLTRLYLRNNQLTSLPLQIGQLTNLTRLYLYNNQLTSLPLQIGQLTNLIHLDLYSNQLTSLPPEIGQLTNLTVLDLSDNRFISLPPQIGQLTNLTKLYLSYNQLTSLPPEIGQLRNLTRLYLSGNQLASLPPEIGQLRNLTRLDLSVNQLTSLPPQIGQLTNLTRLILSNNPIEYIPLNIRRLLQRQKAYGIYSDTQSVHNSNIQQTLKESILRLLGEKIIEEDVVSLVLSDSVLTPFTKESLVEYSKDESIHTVLNLTFSDLLILVWNRILVSSHSNEIKAVLNTEMTDAECKCFTGRMSRLVNCLNGFDSLVSIKISDNEQIGNIISVIRTQLEERNEYTVEKHKSEAKVRLEELSLTEEKISSWLSYIEEE